MNKKIIATANFSNGPKHYFFDFGLAANNCNYLKITQSISQPNGTYVRRSIPFWEEDLHLLIACLSDVFLKAAYFGEPEETVQDIFRKNKEMREKGIKSWEPALRPREKMLEHGAASMLDAELLAMLIGSGTPNETAVDLAARILNDVEGSLLKLAALDLKALCGFAGMGVAKSCSVMAAMELAKRMYPMLNVKPVKTMRISSGAYVRRTPE